MTVESSNPIVRNAMAARNAAWHGNPYKCPLCGSTNGWTYDGTCKKCRRKLPVQKYAERINELVRRKIVSPNNPQDLKNLATISGVPVDILRGKLGRDADMKDGTGALKLKQKHSGIQGKGSYAEKVKRDDTSKIGFTIAKGKVAPTSKGSKEWTPKDEYRDAILHKGYVGYLDKHRDGRYTLTTHYKSGADEAKEERIRKRMSANRKGFAHYNRVGNGYHPRPTAEGGAGCPPTEFPEGQENYSINLFKA